MRKFTIAEIKRRVLQRADMQNSNFIKPQELLDYINEAYAELYDVLTQKGQNYRVETAFINLIAGTDTYDMPDDFYKIIAMDYEVANNHFVSLGTYNELERNSSISTSSNIPSGRARVTYVPAPDVYTDDAEEIDGIAGWEALLITDAAIMCLDKEESNTDRLERRRARLMKRIEEMSQNRDMLNPGRVNDVYSSTILRSYNALRYRMYGDQVRFIATELTGSEFLGVE